jgi:hypothetical protein
MNLKEQLEQLNKVSQDLQDTTVVKLKNDGETLESISKITGLSLYSVYKITVRNDVRFKGGKKRNTITPEIVTDILEMVSNDPLVGPAHIHKVLLEKHNKKITYSGVYNFMRDNGFVVTRGIKKLRDDARVKQTEILSLYEDGITPSKISEKLGLGYQQVLKVLKTNKVFKSAKVPVVRDENYHNTIIDLLSKGHRMSSIAKIMNTDYTSLTFYVKKNDLKKYFKVKDSVKIKKESVKIKRGSELVCDENTSKKSCSKCKEVKSVNLFFVDKKQKSGLSPQCKECYKKSINKEKRALSQKRFLENNPNYMKNYLKKDLVVSN